MRAFFVLLCLAIPIQAYAQISVDSSRYFAYVRHPSGWLLLLGNGKCAATSKADGGGWKDGAMQGLVNPQFKFKACWKNSTKYPGNIVTCRIAGDGELQTNEASCNPTGKEHWLQTRSLPQGAF